MSALRLSLFVLAVLAAANLVGASESDELREKAKAVQPGSESRRGSKQSGDELREKAKAVQREAVELGEQGRMEEAANLKRKAAAMLEEAERLQHGRLDERQGEAMKLKQGLEKLRLEEKLSGEKEETPERRAEIRREAERIQARLRELSHQPHHEPAAGGDEHALRLESIRLAVEHLKRAGLHDIAEHVARQAKDAGREPREQPKHPAGDVISEIAKQLDELRHEVGRLRDEVNELRRK